MIRRRRRQQGHARHSLRARPVLLGALGALMGVVVMGSWVPSTAQEPPAPAEEPVAPTEQGLDPTAPFSTPLVASGDVVITRQQAGEVVALAPDGTLRTLASGLSGPRGVVVLADGSVVVAEVAANRIIGIGGRYPETPTTIVEYPWPAGLTTLEGGRLRVTSFAEGRVSEIDLATGEVVDLAGGLDTPLALIVRDGVTFVTEYEAGWLTRVGPDGEVERLAGDLAEPGGLAFAPGDGFFVTEAATGEVARLDGDGRTVIATVPTPGELLVVYPDEATGEAVLLVATAEGLVSVDTTSGTVTPVAELADAVGLVIVTEVAAPPPPAPTTTEALTEAEDELGLLAPTDAADTDTDLAGADEREVEVRSFLPVIILAGLILAGVLAIFVVQVRRAQRDERELNLEGFGDDDAPLHDAFGPLVGEELALERTEAALEAVALQLDRAQRRADAAVVRVQELSGMLETAKREREGRLGAARLAVIRGEADDDQPHPVHAAAGLLTTDEGKEAYAQYKAGTLSPVELAKRWADGSEGAALELMRGEGARSRKVDLEVPGAEERRLIAELARAEGDVVDARDDIVRFTAREQECKAKVWEAQAALRAGRSEEPDAVVAVGEDSEQAEAWGMLGRPHPPVPPSGSSS